MTDRLDRLVTRLAEAPTDRSLDRFEAEIDRAIIDHRAEARRAAALDPVRAASVALSLAIGVAAGSVAAAGAVAQPPQFEPFGVTARLAPSTLLAGD